MSARNQQKRDRENRTAVIENEAKYGYIRRLGFRGPDLGHDSRIIWESPLTILTFTGDDWEARSKSSNMVCGRGTDRDDLDTTLGYSR